MKLEGKVSQDEYIEEVLFDWLDTIADKVWGHQNGDISDFPEEIKDKFEQTVLHSIYPSGF